MASSVYCSDVSEEVDLLLEASAIDQIAQKGGGPSRCCTHELSDTKLFLPPHHPLLSNRPLETHGACFWMNSLSCTSHVVFFFFFFRVVPDLVCTQVF